ncbi:SOS response-associated peptidase [Iodidimonas sp. SYSU 1G8]|uniref:SOS response-associated peptidase n=1 Tax=Iodidimonas sp. SYSU 1G8 TaxID=3133967 RepID=UPI0031FED7ED
MCGRLASTLTWTDVADYYRLLFTKPLNLQVRLNIAPTEDVLVVLRGRDKHCNIGRHAGMMRWGLVPHWAGEMPKAATFNARAEGIGDKPMWRDPLRHRRCVVTASSFYEWTGEKGARVPMNISRADGEPLSLAGLWDRNLALGTLSCTVIVTTANDQMQPIHDRMPVILEADAIDRWLEAPDEALLAPSAAPLRIEPASPALNRPGTLPDNP